ncbi:leukocyte tyrosine kinase receptor [Microcaecilia unicolor]|uniref:Tyrosine-protein kinase receptor n=1 Tax=Microcaecilia unicolor TaxID=1415580 RepID=A0A6P7YVS4_9AMPH|nr:leukocyte tyrosine kinase receptor [Microcaecilia unicolor]
MDCLPHLPSALQLALGTITMLLVIICSGLDEKNISTVKLSGEETASYDQLPSAGGILLFNFSHFSERCEFHFQSHVLPRSSASCLLELLFYSWQEIIPERFTVQIQHLDTNLSTHIPLRQEGEEWIKGAPMTVQIGQVNGPFRISLLYSSCGLDNSSGLMALDSLGLKNCFHDEEGLHISPCSNDFDFPCMYGGCISNLQVCNFHTNCPNEEDEGTICMQSLPEGAYCSFEVGTCGWTLDDTAAIPWSFKDSENMGHKIPFLGSSLQATRNHFLYLRVQSQEEDGAASAYSARLPAMVASNTCQVQFAVHIIGTLNGSVSLFLVEESAVTGKLWLVWETVESLGDYWSIVTRPLPELQNQFHLKLLASWGWNSLADVAVDNITFGLDCFSDERRPVDSERHQVSRNIDILEDMLLFPPPQSSILGDPSEMDWLFRPCGATGPHGPSQVQCDIAYRKSSVSVMVEEDAPLQGVQMWKVPATDTYKISAYGAAGGKGAKNPNKRSHGVFIAAIFQLQKDEVLSILVGQQGGDACPGGNALTKQICRGESSIIEEEYKDKRALHEWAGGGGGGGGASYVFKQEHGVFKPLIIAAGGGGKSYMEHPDSSLDHMYLEQFENNTAVPGLNGISGVAGGGGGWKDITHLPWSGKSLLEGAEGGQACNQSLAKLQWATFGGFGGGGGACTAGGGGGGYRGGNASRIDDITANGQDGVSFVNPIGKIFLGPLAVMESDGEVRIQPSLNCSHCSSGNCKQDKDLKVAVCVCLQGTVLASDSVTCRVMESDGEVRIQPSLNCSHCSSGNCKQDKDLKVAVCVCLQGTVLASDSVTCRAPMTEGPHHLPLILTVVTTAVVLGMVLTCSSFAIVYHRKKPKLDGTRTRLQSPEYKLSKIRTSTIMTDYNPNYCFVGKASTLSELKELPRRNISLIRALGHGAFGEVYEGTVTGIAGDLTPLRVAIKTLPEISSEQDEMDFLMEALIISKFSHQNIVQCIGVSLQMLPRFILLELMAGGDMKSFLRQNRPRMKQPSTLTMQDLLNMARDIACGCKYLEENHFIHRDIAARNCLLTCSGKDRVAKIGDFGMARDIYRASYYRKGGRAMLPVKWMPPEAFLEGVFTSKTDTWSFGVLLWEIFSLGYMPYPCKTNQEVLEFVTSGGRMDPPKKCPGPVYRIMTQCWQHSPEYRPDFSTILERIKYCTQDPDVINTELPIECGPAPEDEGETIMRPTSSEIAPLLVTPILRPQLTSRKLEVEHTVHKLGDHPQELLVESLGDWNMKSPSVSCLTGSNNGSWIHQNSSPIEQSKLQITHKLKNKPQNLWNPTYGSWVMEGVSSNSSFKAVPDQEDSGFDGNCSSCPSSRASPDQDHCSHLGIGGLELDKPQMFPCGNVNYAYDDLNYETEDTKDRAAVLRNARLQADAQILRKPEKTSGERDSGLSLSDDISITPV